MHCCSDRKEAIFKRHVLCFAYLPTISGFRSCLCLVHQPYDEHLRYMFKYHDKDCRSVCVEQAIKYNKLEFIREYHVGGKCMRFKLDPDTDCPSCFQLAVRWNRSSLFDLLKDALLLDHLIDQESDIIGSGSR